MNYDYTIRGVRQSWEYWFVVSICLCDSLSVSLSNILIVSVTFIIKFSIYYVQLSYLLHVHIWVSSTKNVDLLTLTHWPHMTQVMALVFHKHIFVQISDSFMHILKTSVENLPCKLKRNMLLVENGCIVRFLQQTCHNICIMVMFSNSFAWIF